MMFTPVVAINRHWISNEMKQATQTADARQNTTVPPGTADIPLAKINQEAFLRPAVRQLSGHPKTRHAIQPM